MCGEQFANIDHNRSRTGFSVTRKKMVQNFTRTELIIWTIAFAVESLAIIVGNSVTIAVFWKQRLTLKRTRYLLINLSVADLLIGACVNEDIVCFPLKNDACKVSQKNKSG